MSEPEFQLEYPNGPHIHRGVEESEIQDLAGYLDARRRDVGTEWVWYRLPTFYDAGIGIGIELGFNHGLLEELTLFHDDPEAYGKDWSEWSEEKERLRAETTRLWLETKGYKTGSYPWGAVCSFYDPKSGFGACSIRYRQQSE